jgi:hypothetical protein
MTRHAYPAPVLPNPDEPDALLDTEQAAAFLRVRPAWLMKGRANGYGPRFVRLGPRLIRYSRRALALYAQQNTVPEDAA